MLYSRLLKKSASGVLAALRRSTYGPEYVSPLRLPSKILGAHHLAPVRKHDARYSSHRAPCWTAFLNSLRAILASSQILWSLLSRRWQIVCHPAKTLGALSLTLTVLAASPSWADFQARVVMVHEGDRITIYHGGRNQIVFLQDIDCPELKQPYGKQAKRAATAYLGGREVIVRGLKPDAHGRTTAEILLADGRNVGQELLKEGLAWWKRSGSGDRSLEQLEELARASGKGLWAEPNPVPPWKWKTAKKTSRKYSN
jgi:endonuclease YncB( thermonuclease family)